jgi:tRNA-dihydrouridine synthase C
MRLGWDTIDAIDDNAHMAAEGGAAWVTIHGRTRFAGYSPPIYWEPIGRVREQLQIPVVANGDIWTLDDFRRCRDATGCQHFMLGRGALANPLLARQIARELGINRHEPEPAFNWPTLLHRLVEWSKRFVPYRSESLVRRLKQWLKLAATFGSFRGFEAIKRAGTVEELMQQMPA